MKNKPATLILGASFIAAVLNAMTPAAGAAEAAAAPRKPSVFQQMDANGDQAISIAEFQAARNAWFNKLDANGDGKLTLEEYAGDQQDRFKEMDANGDGVVVLGEYVFYFCGTESRGTEKPGPEKTGKTTLFETMDTDNNGLLTVPECEAYRVAIFRQLDANGDGKLMPEEFAAGAAKRFAAMGVDKDNLIPKGSFDAMGSKAIVAGRAGATNQPAAK